MSNINTKSLKVLNNFRNVNFNKTIAIDSRTVEELAEKPKEFFGSILDYLNEISSLKISLINTDIFRNYKSRSGSLKTPKGVVDGLADELNYVYRILRIAVFKVEYYNFYDLKPYTSTYIYLPLYGYFEIDISNINNKFVHILICVDASTGQGTYIIGYTDSESALSTDNNFTLMATLDFSFTIDIPVGSTNIGDIRRNLILDSIKLGVTGVALAYSPSVAVSTASTVTTNTSTFQSRNPATNRLRTTGKTTDTEETISTSTRTIDKSRPASDAIKSGIDIINRNFSGTTQSKAYSNTDIISTDRNNVYILKKKRKFIIPTSDYYHLYGKPLGGIYRIGSCQGFTKICDVHVEAIGDYVPGDLMYATAYEKDLIAKTLYEGIII